MSDWHVIAMRSTHATELRGELASARAAFEARTWERAYKHFGEADASQALDAEDVERFAVAAFLAGHDDVSSTLWTRAHHEHARRHDVPRAVRCVFWIVLELLNTGELAQASGWLVRGRRLLDGGAHDCPECGLLLVLAARLHVLRSELAQASEAAKAASAQADRFDDPDLNVFGRLILAQVRARTGAFTAAAALFDETMIAATVDEVSPIAVGTVYCAVIDACRSIFDLERAREWTEALSRWYGAHPELVRFRGQCLVHRAEILRLSGELTQAAKEAANVCYGGRNMSSHDSLVGAAFYELAEIHRVRGHFSEAEDAYREATQHGHSPEPGLALLRLSQGHADAAVAAIRRVTNERRGQLRNAPALAACVEIMLGAGDVAAAEYATNELAVLTEMNGTRYLRALAAQARGNVLLVRGEGTAALFHLRAAWMLWQELDAPFEAARVRVLLALACRALGDHDAAALELDAAGRVFQRLAAIPELDRVAAFRAEPQRPSIASLTSRELEVIRLIAGGKTNRAIAAQLAISERTVDRHVGNILRKLDLSSRTAATAYAYHHGLM